MSVSFISEAAVGEDLVLSSDSDGRLVLHQLSEDGGVRLLGAFDDAVDAWAVIDALDLALAPQRLSSAA
jgi:hypothetical protein